MMDNDNYSFNNREFWVCMIFFSLIILFYLYLCLRCVFSHLLRRRDTRRHITLIPLQLRDIHNPHLLTVPSITGLDPIILSSLPTFRFIKKVFDRDDDSDDTMINCVVCLCDLEGEEKAKLLPNCNHFFHVSCIDTWLNYHTTCPLCRAEVNLSRLEQEDHKDPICYVTDDLYALDNTHARLGVDGGCETSKNNRSNLRLSSIRRIFSREISLRRIQPSHHDDEDGEGVDHDLESQ